MERAYSCPECCQAIYVTGTGAQHAQLERVFPHLPRKCCTDGCAGEMEGYDIVAVLLKQRTGQRMSVPEFLAAITGLGTAGEQMAAPADVGALLGKGQGTTFVLKPSSNPQRTILEAIEVEGVTLHVAAGPEGAVIYKITRKDHERTRPMLQADPPDRVL